MSRIWTHGIASNRRGRVGLNRALKFDGRTVADYQPGNYTGALNASAWANSIGTAGSLLQATGANQPIVLGYSGTNYLWLPGVAGNYASAPDSVPLSITGDIDLRARAALDDWTPAVANQLINKATGAGNQRSYQFAVVATTGLLRLIVSTTGADNVTFISTVAPTVSDSGELWVRATLDVDNGSGNSVATFYTSSDGGAWNQLGDTVPGAVLSIFDSTSTLGIGASADGTVEGASGRIFRAQIYNGIAGTLVFDANFTAVAEGATTFTESSANGATVTINNTGSKPAQIVGSSSLLADGTAHKMATANFTLNQPVYGWIVAKQITYTTNDWLLSGTAGIGGIIGTTATPNISVNAGASAADNTEATLGAWHVIEYCLNGASSYISVDGAAQTTGDAGAGNPGGLSLFSDSGGLNYGNWQVKEWIVRTAAQAQIQKLLKQIHGTP